MGGGSTECNLLSEGKLIESRSFNIGTVRILTDKVNPREQEDLHEFLEDIHRKYPEITIIGSGGNINKLNKMAYRDEKTPGVLGVDDLARLYHTLAPLSVKQRMERFGLRRDRADVIIPAAEIFLNIASVVGANRIIVPTIGVADGIIDGLYLADSGKQ